MGGPIDYSIPGVADPQQQFLAGIQAGNGLEQMQMQRAQQAAALQQQQQMQQTLQALALKPGVTGADYARVMTMYPQLSEHLKRASDTMTADQQASTLSHSSQVLAAMRGGQNDLAAQLAEQRATAAENAGLKDQAQAARALAAQIKTDPTGAQAGLMTFISAIPGGDKVITGLGQIGTEGREAARFPTLLATDKATLGVKQSEQVIKGVEAANAQTATTLDNQKKAQEIRASQLTGDIARINAQIASANSETDRGKLILERDKMVLEQQKLQQAQGFSAQDTMDNLTGALQTVKELKTHPGLEGFWFGAGTMGGKQAGFFPGTESKDFRAKVDTLKSQQFLAQAKQMQGMGALSDAEGARLERAVASLDTDQSAAQFKTALGVIENLLQKGQAKLVARGQLPSQGEAFVMKHPVYGNVTDGQINALMRQYAGSTREQILQFLQSTGGK